MEPTPEHTLMVHLDDYAIAKLHGNTQDQAQALAFIIELLDTSTDAQVEGIRLAQQGALDAPVRELVELTTGMVLQ